MIQVEFRYYDGTGRRQKQEGEWGAIPRVHDRVKLGQDEEGRGGTHYEVESVTWDSPTDVFISCKRK